MVGLWLEEYLWSMHLDEGPASEHAVNRCHLQGLGVGQLGQPDRTTLRAAADVQEFYAAVADQSWLTVVQGAAHGTFLDAGFALNFVFDRLCHRGSQSRQVSLIDRWTVPYFTGWASFPTLAQFLESLLQWLLVIFQEGPLVC